MICKVLAEIRLYLCTAWLARDWQALEQCRLLERQHKADCPACAGDLYRQLWPAAIIAKGETS